MKKVLATALVLVLGIMILSPSVGYAGPYDRAYYGRGYYDHGPRKVVVNNVRYERGYYNDGWTIAGVALGGLALGAIMGSALAQPRPATVREVAYAAPACAPSPVYGTSYSSEAPPGQWVTVKGQWVNGQWVPAHKIWVPVNP